MSDYFYGWYFRCQGRDGSVAVIPAVHVSSGKCSCSIQVITQNRSLCREFPIAQFRMNRKSGRMQIGENLFSRRGIRLRFEAFLQQGKNRAAYDSEGKGRAGCENAESENVSAESEKKTIMVSGMLRFGAFSKPKYDIMGPFAWVPGMECRHTVYSMRHTVDGELSLNQEKMRFQNGVGYMEGDSGTSFPEKYFWTQHFLPSGSIMIAAASIPLAGIHFTGTLGFLLRGNKEYRFATYLGASVKKMGDRELVLHQGSCHLHVRLPESGGSELKAPDCGKMTRRIRENVSGKAEYTLMCGNRILLHEMTDRAAAEYDEKE